MSTTTLTNTPTTKPTNQHHEIKITKQGTNAVPGTIPTMAVGDTVRYSSVSGEVRILFPERSPFRTDDEPMTSVPGGVILTLVSGSRGGTLECRCFITGKDKSEVGWSSPENLISGGRHKVTPP
jgi:hypothetical protein